MNLLANVKDSIDVIEKQLGYTFKDKDLLIMAFVHRSYANEQKNTITDHNERLEFLGDSVLGVIVADFLYNRFPDVYEGTLSLYKSSLVDEISCASYVRFLGLSDYILLGKGEVISSGNRKLSILADVFEAVIAAIYLDGGMDKAKNFFLTQCNTVIEDVLKQPHRNFKAELQDYSQKHHKITPVYKITKEDGPDHAKIFFVEVWLDSKVMAIGKGSSKKEAEQDAARQAIKGIKTPDK
jgi:ribonuclease III